MAGGVSRCYGERTWYGWNSGMLSRRAFLILTGAGMAAGCGGSGSNEAGAGWGKQGRRFGEFLRPRAIGVHAGEVYVIDTTGRVQVFDEAGTYLRHWELPDSENGTPTAIAFHENGRVLIPDTHYSRVLEYSPEGEMLAQWGSFGTGEDEFIYPTGIAVGEDGCYYLSEYGVGAERIHVFDAERKFLRQWGSHGEDNGQFNRAMAIDVSQSGEILVADTANHRIQFFATDGTWRQSIHALDDTHGPLKFPHDMKVAPDDTFYVAEYGSHRVSRFNLDGTLVEVFGEAGRGPGQVNAPRGVAVSKNNRVYVADTDNHRIQVFKARAMA